MLNSTPPSGWPAPIGPEGLDGLLGEFVRLVEPETEADPAAVLVQALVVIGNIVGRTAGFRVAADLHYPNLYAGIVGQTSKGRKGISFSHVRQLGRLLAPAWAVANVQAGLSSGEGLIHAVRNPAAPAGTTTGADTARASEPDRGVKDKRLLVVESEFASVLKASGRQGSILSTVMRQAWDTGDLQTLTKNSPVSATGAHISIIGHITREELTRELTQTDKANGFANRFLWVMSRRSKPLPDGGRDLTEEIGEIALRIKAALASVSGVGMMTRDDEAAELWRSIYPDLSEGRVGLYGAVTSRSEAQVMRIACIFALVDGYPFIRLRHLKAALEVWRYADDSARFIFGDSVGDRNAEELFGEIASRPDGMTRTSISDFFSGNLPKVEIDRMLKTLEEAGRIESVKSTLTGQGRPPERWRVRVEWTKETKETK